MIVMFTDFGADDIYVAQMKAAILRDAPPGTQVLDLLHRVPNFDIAAGAHLLAALVPKFPRNCVFLTVVDPGVGGERDAIVLDADGQRFVGPDNGLLSVVQARATAARVWRIIWRPAQLSATFHGRDLFAPVAARIAGGHMPSDMLEPIDGLAVSIGGRDLGEVVHVDHYGNAITGLRASGIAHDCVFEVGGRNVAWARTFADVPPGTAFWHENSIGLVEIAVSCGHGAAQLGLQVHSPVRLVASVERELRT